MSSPGVKNRCHLSERGRDAQDVPVASAPPLWRVLRAALEEQHLSVRAFARMLADADPSQTFESWNRSLRRYLAKDAVAAPVPNQDTAELMARLLGKPPGYFVRPRQRVELRQERDELRREIQRLRARLREHGIDPEGPAGSDRE